MKSTIKHILLSILVFAYLIFAVGHIFKLDVEYAANCLDCRIGDYKITKEDKRIMRYFGVNGMKILAEERFVMYNGKWHKVVKGKYEGVTYSLEKPSSHNL